MPGSGKAIKEEEVDKLSRANDDFLSKIVETNRLSKMTRVWKLAYLMMLRSY